MAESSGSDAAGPPGPDGLPDAQSSASQAVPADKVIDPRFAVTSFEPPPPEVQFVDRVRRTPEEKARAAQLRASKRRRRTVISWVMLGAGALVLLATGWVALRGYQAYSHLQSASAKVSQLQKELADIPSVDPAATKDTLVELQDETASARNAVDDPLFRSATVLPFLGPNLDTVREVTLTVDELATGVMPSLVDVATTLRPAALAPAGGAISLEPISRIAPLLQEADAAVTRSRQRMGAIDRSAVVQPVGDAVMTLWRKLDQASDVIDPGARIARLLPPMLGAAGPRTYLVAFQNPAELRSTGGIFGSYALIVADHGKISITDQGASSRTFGLFKPPVAELTKKQVELYTTLMAQYPQDVNFTPDFPTAAALFAEMYRMRKGVTVDGVLAIDPVALSYTLKGAAPIDVGDGVSVTADNLVPILLSTAYQKFDEADQSQRDGFLAEATGKVFSHLMSGAGDAGAMVDGLRKAVGERRVLLFSADPSEQADIAASNLAGGIDGSLQDPSVGVFMNDGTGAKLGYYLHNEVHLSEGQCRTDGRRELQVSITMRYDAPSSGLPAYVTGPTEGGQRYELRTNVLALAPAGGGVVDATRDGAPSPMARGEDHSREVGTTTVTMTPGTSTVVVFTVLGPAGGAAAHDVAPRLIMTPGVSTWSGSVDPYRVCRGPGS